MRYELIREIFNSCSNNQMRDVFVTEVETDDPLEVMMQYCKSREEIVETENLPDGTAIFHVVSSGLRQRYSFTPDD